MLGTHAGAIQAQRLSEKELLVDKGSVLSSLGSKREKGKKEQICPECMSLCKV